MAVKIINLCVSLVSDTRRGFLLLSMLRSWICQRKRHELRLLLHCTTKEIRDYVYEDALDKFIARHKDLIVIESPKVTQIEGYQQLLSNPNLDPAAWIMFTDDDDLWAPWRMEVAEQLIRNMLNSDNPQMSRVLGRQLGVVEYPSVAGRFQKMLLEGIIHDEENGLLQPYETADRELWAQIVRIDVAQDVFARITNPKFAYGDLLTVVALKQHATKLGGANSAVTDKPWTYFYRRSVSKEEQNKKVLNRGLWFPHVLDEFPEHDLKLQFAQNLEVACSYVPSKCTYDLIKPSFERSLLKAGLTAMAIVRLRPQFVAWANAYQPHITKLRESYGICEI